MKNSKGLTQIGPIIAVIIIIALAITGYWLVTNKKNNLETAQLNVKMPQSIAVLPFVNMSTGSGEEYFGDGLTDGILNALAHLEGLNVCSRSSSFQFRGKDVDIQEVGKKLNVRTVLEGSIQKQGTKVRIIAQLINVEDGFHFWSEQYDENMDDIFELQNKIANAIAKKLQITFIENESPILAKKPTSNIEAYKLYLQGRASWNLRTVPELKKGIDFFQQAISLDTSYAAAYAGLADCYTALGYGSFLAPKEVFPRALEAAKKAIRLDPTLAEPHASMGYYEFYYEWDWAAAEQEFRKAIALNKNYALAYDWYGYYLTAMQRYDEANVILNKARDLDPLSLPINTDIGFSLYYSGHYDRSIAALQSALQMNPDFPLAHLWTGRVFQEKKMYEESLTEYKKTLQVIPAWPVAICAMGNVYGLMGEPAKARQILDTLTALSKNKFVTAYGMGLVYAGLADKEKAFECLNKAFDERSNWLVWLKTDPRWAAIRSDKRFTEIVHRVGLPD